MLIKDNGHSFLLVTNIPMYIYLFSHLYTIWLSLISWNYTGLCIETPFYICLFVTHV